MKYEENMYNATLEQNKKYDIKYNSYYPSDKKWYYYDKKNDVIRFIDVGEDLSLLDNFSIEKDNE